MYKRQLLWFVISNSKDLDKIESDCKKSVSESKIEAKRNSVNQTINNISELNTIIKENINSSNPDISAILDKLNKIKEPYKRDLFASANKIIRLLMLEKNSESNLLKEWLGKLHVKTQYDYSSHLYSESKYNLSLIHI